MNVAQSDVTKSTGDMPLLQHLSELRVRMLWCMAMIILGSSISLFFAERAIVFLTEPYGGLLQIIEPTEGFSVYLRVGLTGGLALSSPLLIYQIIAFVSPGLTKRERNIMIVVVPGALLLFVVGSSFAWFVMTPAAIDFLSQFMNELFIVNWTSRSFIKFVLTITLWIGLAFEMPLVIMCLAWLGLVTPRKLLRGWRIAIVIISILSAAITPTIDPFNMFLVMAPLVGLYLFSISLSVLPHRARKRRLA